METGKGNSGTRGYLLQLWDGSFWDNVGSFPASYRDVVCRLALQNQERGDRVRVVCVPSNDVLSDEQIRESAARRPVPRNG